MAVPGRSILPEPQALLGNTEGQIRQRFQALTAARVMVCTVIFGGTIAVFLAEGHNFDAPTPQLLLRVIIAIYTLSLVYALQIRRAPRARLIALTRFSIAMDLVAWTALAFATGGAASPLSTLFGLTTLTAALVLGGNGTLWTAVSALGCYGIMALLLALGVVQPPPDQLNTANAIETTYQMLVTLTSIASITAIGGALADRLVVTGGALLRVEQSRANLLSLYEDVLRSIPQALITFDAEGAIDGANPFAALFLDLEPSQILRRPVGEVLPFLPPAAVEGSAGSASGDARLKTDWREIPVAWHVAPLYDRNGARRGGIVVVDDRSQEEALRGAVESAERFAVLGRLAAGLAHEIRNPLSAISGCVELVRETARLDDEEVGLLTTVTRDVARLNDLVTDMLQFARPRPPERSTTDLVAVAREVLGLARTSGGPESRVTIELTGAEAMLASADAAQVKQVLWNLIRNAAQVSRPGTRVTVDISGSPHEAEIRVLDRGPGVPDEMRDRIFETFFSGTARGTGLGLAIVKRIAESHQGRVEVHPRDGGGSVFAVTIARADSRPPTSPSDATTDPPDARGETAPPPAPA